MQRTQNANLNFLQQELRVIAQLGLGVLLIGFGVLSVVQDWQLAGLWLFRASLIWAYVCLCVWRRLPLNRASLEAPLYGSLGWGNRLTILRGGFIALTGGFLFMQQTLAAYLWLPALFYTLAAILDRLDGFAARRSRQISLLGNELDITFDALGLVIAPLLAIGLGKLHLSYLLLSVAYYVYRWGLQRRSLLGLPLYDLPGNPLRRTLAGFQMAFVALVLWPLLDPELTAIAGIAFMLPVLFGFAADWWVVCGRLTPQAYQRLANCSAQYFQPGLRLLVPLLLVLLIPDTIDTAGKLLVLGAVLVLLGLAGRLGALIVIVSLGWHYPHDSNPIVSYGLIFAASWILLLGTGRYSLWRWGDDWIQRYDGA
ncbi:CDP-alcohol phosphatidyltransferase family protein [Methylomonas sp. TEB]|uniref:CDP-alcohol phosphatidyltransferase family protein n=1 Tax=Methylomonas sp. TEB TaxID=3398229 RepID=UPI0039F5C4E3